MHAAQNFPFLFSTLELSYYAPNIFYSNVGPLHMSSKSTSCPKLQLATGM